MQQYKRNFNNNQPINNNQEVEEEVEEEQEEEQEEDEEFNLIDSLTLSENGEFEGEEEEQQEEVINNQQFNNVFTPPINNNNNANTSNVNSPYQSLFNKSQMAGQQTPIQKPITQVGSEKEPFWNKELNPDETFPAPQEKPLVTIDNNLKKTNTYSEITNPKQEINHNNIPNDFLYLFEKIKYLNFEIDEAKKFLNFNLNTLLKLNAVFSFIENNPIVNKTINKIINVFSTGNTHSIDLNTILINNLGLKKQLGLKIISEPTKIDLNLQYANLGFSTMTLPPNLNKTNLFKAKNGNIINFRIADTKEVIQSTGSGILVAPIKNLKTWTKSWYALIGLIGTCFMNETCYFIYLLKYPKNIDTPFFLLVG